MNRSEIRKMEREMKEEVLRQQYNLNRYELVFLTIAGLLCYPVVVLFDFLDDMLDLRKTRSLGV